MKGAKAVLIGTQLTPGERYRFRNGGVYECLSVSESGKTRLRSVASGVAFTVEAADVTMYDDGSIAWTKIEDIDYTNAEVV